MLRLDLGTAEKLCHQLFLLSPEIPPAEREPSDRPDRRALSHRWARLRFLPGPSGPTVPVAPRSPPLHPSTTAGRRLSWPRSSPTCGESNEVRERRASLLR